MKDTKTSKFNFPFDNNNIIEECEKAINYVPFPVSGFLGYTDKNSFNIYIYSNFKIDSLKTTFTE